MKNYFYCFLLIFTVFATEASDITSMADDYILLHDKLSKATKMELSVDNTIVQTFDVSFIKTSKMSFMLKFNSDTGEEGFFLLSFDLPAGPVSIYYFYDPISFRQELYAGSHKQGIFEFKLPDNGKLDIEFHNDVNFVLKAKQDEDFVAVERYVFSNPN